MTRLLLYLTIFIVVTVVFGLVLGCCYILYRDYKDYQDYE